jgi:hypothetical protein
MTFTPKPRIRQYWVWAAARPFERQVCKAAENTGDALIERNALPTEGTIMRHIMCKEDASHKSENRLALEPVKIKPIYQLEDGWSHMV